MKNSRVGRKTSNKQTKTIQTVGKGKGMHVLKALLNLKNAIISFNKRAHRTETILNWENICLFSVVTVPLFMAGCSLSQRQKDKR